MSKDAGIIKRLDEAVVNRIAAGEVIQRPANALKELLENSLDAQSTSVTVVVRNGGLGLLQITDNGTGIRKDDLGIVCQRFTTSKLKTFSDLSRIDTYGFRGEALASISHVAKVTILTKTRGQECGYKVQYSDGKPLKDKPQPCAANQGTQISVEDLFYNVPQRKRILKSPSEEFNRIYDVVSKYSIHNSTKVGFTLKKIGGEGGNNNEVRTQFGASLKDNVAAIYGNNIARELIEFDLEQDPQLKFKAHGHITHVNYNTKKLHMLLFINHRLVESTALKRALEAVYAAYLPKGTHPFIYLSVEIAPANVDVNVHPTKHEVHFLNQEEIIEKLQQKVDAKLMSANTSRTFYTQAILPGALVVPDMMSKMTAATKEAAKNMVRTDARDQKLDKFLVRTEEKSENDSKSVTKNLLVQSKESEKVPSKETSTSEKEQTEEANFNLSVASDKLLPMDVDEPTTTSLDVQMSSNSTADKRQKEANYSTDTSKPECSGSRREVKLESVKNLKQLIVTQCHDGLREVVANHTFVGLMGREFALLQHSTRLYVANTPLLTRQLFYQLMLQEFGNCAAIRLNPPADIKSMVVMALESPESGWSEADGEKADLAQTVVDLLTDKADMLDDYFSMEIVCGKLCTIPMLLDGFVPHFKGLPMMVLRLATEVNWQDEEACFDTFAQEVARFYAVNTDPQSEYDDKQHDVEFDAAENWKHVFEHYLYPAMKKTLMPSKICADNKTFTCVANLPDLYKVFERC